jgi:hypothetical protein
LAESFPFENIDLEIKDKGIIIGGRLRALSIFIGKKGFSSSE